MAGQEYTTAAGKTQKKASPSVDCLKCKRKCTEKIDKTMLEEILKSFYDLKTNERQKKIICRHVAEKETRTYLGFDKQPASKTF